VINAGRIAKATPNAADQRVSGSLRAMSVRRTETPAPPTSVMSATPAPTRRPHRQATCARATATPARMTSATPVGCARIRPHRPAPAAGTTITIARTTSATPTGCARIRPDRPAPAADKAGATEILARTTYATPAACARIRPDRPAPAAGTTVAPARTTYATPVGCVPIPLMTVTRATTDGIARRTTRASRDSVPA
jgi:hypothetical protein